MKPLGLFLLLAGCAFAAVANDGSGTASQPGGVSPVTLTGFVSGSGANGCLIAKATLGTGAVTTPLMTLDGVSMGLPFLTAAGVGGNILLFRVVNPVAGSHTLVFSWTGTPTSATITASDWSGVDPSNCPVAADNQTASGNSATTTVTVPSAAGDATVAIGTNTSAYYTAQNQTLIANINSGPIATESNYALGGTSNVHNFTGAGTINWTAAGIHLKAFPAAASCNLLFFRIC